MILIKYQGSSFQITNWTINFLVSLKNVEKKIAWVHSSYLSNDNFYKFYKNKNYVNQLKTERYSKINQICFVSNDAKSEFEQLFGTFKNHRVVYNILNSSDILTKSLENGVKYSKFTFCALGSLKPVKGFDLLIQACSLLKIKGLSFQLNIIGEGPQREELESLIKSLVLRDISARPRFWTSWITGVTRPPSTATATQISAVLK